MRGPWLRDSPEPGGRQAGGHIGPAPGPREYEDSERGFVSQRMVRKGNRSDIVAFAEAGAEY